MREGDLVPDFELPDQSGRPRRLSEFLADGPVVLFFYPAALSPGCTKEACHFRDLDRDFADAGVQRIGISHDEVAKQKRFDDKHGLGYPLLSDAGGDVARLFGVQRKGLLGKLGMGTARWTFAIGRDSRVAAAIHSETNMQTHADQALRALRAA